MISTVGFAVTGINSALPQGLSDVARYRILGAIAIALTLAYLRNPKYVGWVSDVTHSVNKVKQGWTQVRPDGGQEES